MSYSVTAHPALRPAACTSTQYTCVCIAVGIQGNTTCKLYIPVSYYE